MNERDKSGAFDPGRASINGLLPNPFSDTRGLPPGWEACYFEGPDTEFTLGVDRLLMQTTRPAHGIDVVLRTPPIWPVAASFRVKVYAMIGGIGSAVAVDQQRVPGTAQTEGDLVCSVRQYAERFQVWGKLEGALVAATNDPTFRLAALAGPYVGERPAGFNVVPWNGQGSVGAVQDIGGASGLTLFTPSAAGNDDRIEIYGFDAYNTSGATRWVQIWASSAAAPAAALFRSSIQLLAGASVSIRYPAPIIIRGADATIRGSSTGSTYTAIAAGEVFVTTFVRR